METMTIDDKRYNQCEAGVAQTIVAAIIKNKRALTWDELSTILEHKYGSVPGLFEENGLIPALLDTTIDESLRLLRSKAIQMLCGTRS